MVRLAREMGLLKLGTIAVDGTKIKANASRHKAMSYGRMQTSEVELKAQIAALLQKSASTDEAQRNEPDLDIPAELERRQARLNAIEAAKAPDWRSASVKAMHSVGAARTTNASPRAANPISVTLVFPCPKPKTALPTLSHTS